MPANARARTARRTSCCAKSDSPWQSASGEGVCLPGQFASEYSVGKCIHCSCDPIVAEGPARTVTMLVLSK